MRSAAPIRNSYVLVVSSDAERSADLLIALAEQGLSAFACLFRQRSPVRPAP